MAEQPDQSAEEPQPATQDATILVVCDGPTPVPKYVDLQNTTAFHLIAIGEWLALKGRQMVALAENAEARRGVAVPDNEELVRRIVGVGKQ